VELLSSAAGQSDASGESSSLILFPLLVCNDDAISRNEAMGAPDDLNSGWGRPREGNVPTSEAVAPGARRPSQLDPSHPTLVTGQGVDPQPSAQQETAAAHARTDQGKTTASITSKTDDAGTDSENIGHGLEARATHVVESAATVPKAETPSPIVGVARGDGLDLADPCGEIRHLAMATSQGSAPENLGQVPAQGSCGETTCDGITILRNEAIAPDDNRKLENEGPAKLVASGEGGAEEVTESARADERKP
jgi:hypothetical protein